MLSLFTLEISSLYESWDLFKASNWESIELIGSPIINFSKTSTNKMKFFKLFFTSISLFTMAHSAMRLAIPCFIYAFQFINLQNKKWY